MYQNSINLTGTITSNIKFSHEHMGEDFFLTYVKVNRISGDYDIIPIIISENKFDVEKLCVGDYVSCIGKIRTRNFTDENGTHLQVFVLANDVRIIYDADITIDSNQVEMVGYICKTPSYRITPKSKREICNTILSINRAFNKADYIPCIAWGENSRLLTTAAVGNRVMFRGRLQSRDFSKIINETEIICTTYEVSIQDIIIYSDDVTKVAI